MSADEVFMKRCLQLASNGLGTTYPNPLVGSVIVFDGKIIGEGWHRKSGEPHAEVLAIQAVKDKGLLKKSTLYVNLEPCSHYGKTPPCSDLIIDQGIKKVVIGTMDSNEKVCGEGINKLKNSGCEVVLNVMEEECKELNRRFFTFHEQKRPYLILKWAQTADGFIAPYKYVSGFEKLNPQNRPFWVSNELTQSFVHKLRTQEQSILVGSHTAQMDNPSLTARKFFGNQPLRLLIDKDLKIQDKANIFNHVSNTVVFQQKNVTPSANSTNIQFVQIDFKKNVPQQILDYLYQHQIQSVIVEGGRFTLQNFIDQDLWDEAIIIRSQKTLEDGTLAPKFTGKIVSSLLLNADQINHYRNHKK